MDCTRFGFRLKAGMTECPFLKSLFSAVTMDFSAVTMDFSAVTMDFSAVTTVFSIVTMVFPIFNCQFFILGFKAIFLRMFW